MRSKGKKSGRFIGLTGIIDIKKLERESQTFLFIGFVIAVCFHAAIALLFPSRYEEERVFKQFTVDLRITPPRQRKPFIIKKRVFRKRPIYRQEFRFREPSRELPEYALPPFEIPDIDETIRVSFGPLFPGILDSLFEEPLGKVDIPVKRPPYQSVDDMNLSIDAFDYGQFKALVVKDMYDKRNVEGFVYIPVDVWGAELKPLRRPVMGLYEAMLRYTNIKPRLDYHLVLSSPDIFKFPFIYITTEDGFELTPPEKKLFREYLEKGGFAVLDNGFPQDQAGGAEASLRQMLWDVKDALGSAAFIAIIPIDYPLYHCFFDFFDGPPLGAELVSPGVFGIEKIVLDPVLHPVPFLEGLWINNRLAAVYSDKGYGLRWSQMTDNIPQLKMGVNMVVFALTRLGSIAQQKIGYVPAALR